MFDGIQIGTPNLGYALWLLYLAALILVLRRCIGYKRFNTFTIYLPYLFVTNGLLTPLGIEVNSSITGYRLSDLAFRRAWLALGLMYLTMPVGVVIANSFRRHDQRQIQDPIIPRTRRTGPSMLFIVCTLVLSLVSLVQIYIDGIQLDVLKLFTGFDNYGAYAAHRYTFAAVTAGWQYYFYSKLPYAVAPIALILLWNDKTIATKLRWFAIGIITFAVIQPGAKLPFVMIVITLLVSWYLIRHNMVVSVGARVLTVTAVVVLLVLYLPYEYMVQGEQTYASAFYWSIERVFVEPYRALQLYFEVYPDSHPFLHGLSARAVALMLNARDYVSVSVYIPQVFLGIDNTSYPALFIGEAWADFGYIGVGVYSVAVGFLLQIYNVIYYNKRAPYLEDAALLVAVAISTIHLGHSNLVATCFTYGLLTHAAIVSLMKRFGRSAAAVLPDGSRVVARHEIVSAI